MRLEVPLLGKKNCKVFRKCSERITHRLGFREKVKAPVAENYIPFEIAYELLLLGRNGLLTISHYVTMHLEMSVRR
jgi:hypothetical protein